MPRRAGARRCPTGSAPTPAPSPPSARCRRWSCPTTLKSAVIRACFYEPEVNRSYAEMAAHYGTAILPARPYKPRDKAKVEAAVLLVQRWIVARLRNRQFFSLEELNAAIAEVVPALNARGSRHLGASRQQLFERTRAPGDAAAAAGALRPCRLAQGDGRAGLPRPARGATTTRARTASPAASGAADRQHRRDLPRGQARGRHRRSSGNSGTPPSPITCRRAIAAMPIGPSSACARGPPASGPPPRSCAS